MAKKGAVMEREAEVSQLLSATVGVPDLQAAVRFASKATGRVVVVILGCALLEARNGSLRVMCCDGNIWAWQDIPAEVEGEWRACVDAAVLSKIVAALPGNGAVIECSGDSLKIVSGGAEFTLGTRDALDWPEPPELPESERIVVPGEALSKGIRAVLYAVAIDKHFPAYTGVMMESDNGRLAFIANDKQQTAFAYVDVPSEDVRLLLTAEVAEIISTLDGEVALEVEGQWVRASAGTSYVVGNSIADPYPNWRAIRDKHGVQAFSWTMPKADLVGALQRALIASGVDFGRVDFEDAAEKGIRVKAQASFRSADEVIPATKSLEADPEARTSFNGNKALAALKTIDSDQVEMHLSGPTSAILFRGTGDESHFCMLSPVH